MQHNSLLFSQHQIFAGKQYDFVQKNTMFFFHFTRFKCSAVTFFRCGRQMHVKLLHVSVYQEYQNRFIFDLVVQNNKKWGVSVLS